ncbi:hypothetical protein M422DRAFT_52659 [Sphaerobolus stellatus SS14]|uniref:Uncharacterized protein n=1 Tax=Sphaerobolus stellatus (strain SS14) TaxID=990650 RepID=A0A0C9TRX9_SPHS4|nr:hypothetical protein M422DRAFT_52659 [Sphaerobolus stellatus SS14]
MGRNYFRGNALNWLEAKCPDFLRVPLKKRAKWSKQIAEIFLAEYSDYPLPDENGNVMSLEDFCSKINRWFYNNAERLLPSTINSVTRPKKPPTGLTALGIYDHPRTARVIYGDDHKTTINAIASARCAATQEDHSAHAGIWNRVLSMEWENEQASVRAHYEELAHAEKERFEGPLDAMQLHQNQLRVAKALQETLQNLIGFECGQIGDGMIHVQMAYMDGDDQIKLKSFVVRPSASVKTAADFLQLPEYGTSFVEPWTRYAHQVLSDLRLLREPPEIMSQSTSIKGVKAHHLTRDEDGSLLLPQIPQDFKMVSHILTEYIIKSWEHHFREHRPCPALDWRKFTENSNQLLLGACIPAAVQLGEPSTMSQQDCTIFFSHLHLLQQRRIENGEPHMLFRRVSQILNLVNSPAADIQASSASILISLIVSTNSDTAASEVAKHPVVDSSTSTNNTPASICSVSTGIVSLEDKAKEVTIITPIKLTVKRKRAQEPINIPHKLRTPLQKRTCSAHQQQLTEATPFAGLGDDPQTAVIGEKPQGSRVPEGGNVAGRGNRGDRGHGKGRGRGRGRGGRGGKQASLESETADIRG